MYKLVFLEQIAIRPAMLFEILTVKLAACCKQRDSRLGLSMVRAANAKIRKVPPKKRRADFSLARRRE